MPWRCATGERFRRSDEGAKALADMREALRSLELATANDRALSHRTTRCTVKSPCGHQIGTYRVSDDLEGSVHLKIIATDAEYE